MNNNNDEFAVTLELCGTMLMSWLMNGEKNDESFHNELLEKSFVSKILLKKFDTFGIDIKLPDELLFLLSLCSNENPGLVQVILMDLLKNIKSAQGPIPKGYKITASDFANAFPMEFPIIENEKIYNKYVEKFDAIKIIDDNGCPVNLCDTKEWWMRVMQ